MHNLKGLKNVKKRVQLQNERLLIIMLKVNLSMSVSLKDQYRWRTALCVYGSVCETFLDVRGLGVDTRSTKEKMGKNRRFLHYQALSSCTLWLLFPTHTHTRSRMNCGIHGVHFWNSWLWWSSLSSEASVFYSLLMKLCASVYTWHYTHAHTHM